MRGYRSSEWGTKTWLAFTLLLVAPSVGLAQDDDAARTRALDLFEQAETRYQEGAIDDAVALLEQAYATYPSPVLIYNLGRAHEALGHIDQAIEHFERYLEEEPAAEDRGAIQRRLATLRRQRADRERLAREAAQADAATPPPARETDGGAGAWPWVVTGVGAATLAAGGVLGGLALARRQDAVDELEHRRSRQLFRQAEDFALAANVSFAVGGAIALAGFVWILVDATSSGGEPSVEARVGPGWLALRARYP